MKELGEHGDFLGINTYFFSGYARERKGVLSSLPFETQGPGNHGLDRIKGRHTASTRGWRSAQRRPEEENTYQTRQTRVPFCLFWKGWELGDQVSWQGGLCSVWLTKYDDF